MSNVMSLKGVKNRPSRNGFDLSTKRNFTAKCGELLPNGIWEVLPGDTFNINLRAFARTQPLNTSAYARIREYYDFFFVPYSQLWNRSNEVLSQMDYNQMHATQLAPTYGTFNGELPYTTQWEIGSYIRGLFNSSQTSEKMNFFGYDRATLSCKLLEYLGYGDYSGYLTAETGGNLRYNLDLNLFGLLAYQKIYADFYRDEQWEKPSPSCFNVDYMTGQTSMAVTFSNLSDTSEFYGNYNLFDLRYCNWQKDLYHGILPNPQYGETAAVPLGGSSLSDLSIVPSGQPTFKRYSSAADIPTGYNNVVFNSEKIVGSSSPLYVQNEMARSSLTWVNPALEVSGAGSFSSSLSILALRQYEFFQKWKEIAQANDQNYKAQTKAMWGVDVSDLLANRVQYLGGVNTSLDINEVVNTNITGSYAAEIAGKGVSVSNGSISFNGAQEYGFVMCIYHSMPIVDYTVNYVNPSFTRVNAEDFANPVFDRVGMESLSDATVMNEFMSSGFSDTPDNPRMLGYVPRYATYKTNIDLSLGAFRTSLNHWVVEYNRDDMFLGMTSGGAISSVGDTGVPQPEESDITPNYTYLKVNPNMLDPIFAKDVDSTVDTDQFLISSFLDVKVVRNLDTDGLPY